MVRQDRRSQQGKIKLKGRKSFFVKLFWAFLDAVWGGDRKALEYSSVEPDPAL